MYSPKKSNIGNRMVRSFFAMIDSVVYTVLAAVYGVFFNVASAELFSATTIAAFFSRVQIIIGVYMIFRVSISILNGIVNPDGLISGKDENGISKLIVRVMVSLVMLVLIIPISLPDSNPDKVTWEDRINDNGLLFGTLYDLQDRLLRNNTIGKLILGTSSSSENTGETITNMGTIFAADVIKSFLTPNIKPEAVDKVEEIDENRNIVPKYANKENLVCSGDFQTIKDYAATNDPDVLFDMINEDCKYDGKKRFTFNYMILLPTLVGILFIFVLVFFTLDVAIRVIKLGILRLLAPIPIISYIDPKSQKDGAFGNWVKTLTSTYLDLFLRLGIIFFALFLIQEIMINGLGITNATGFVGILTKIIIYIGIFFFAKQAPKFIKDMLGIKGTGGLGIGLSGLVGGTAALMGGAGLAGARAAALQSMDTSAEAAAQGKQAPPAWSTGRDLAAQIKSGDPKAKGGIINRATNKALRNAGVTQARKRYGVTAKGIQDAKDNMYAAQAKAAAATDRYDRFRKGEMTADEISAFDDYVRAQVPAGTPITAALRDQHKNDYMENLYKESADLQTTAAKAKTHYDDAKKFADEHRVMPTFAEEHQRSLRERLPGHGRADLERQGDNRYTAHHNIRDRILGQREKWYNDTTTRDDNRWDPSKYS